MAESSKYLFLSKCLACIDVSFKLFNKLRLLNESIK